MSSDKFKVGDCVTGKANLPNGPSIFIGTINKIYNKFQYKYILNMLSNWEPGEEPAVAEYEIWGITTPLVKSLFGYENDG